MRVRVHQFQDLYESRRQGLINLNAVSGSRPHKLREHVVSGVQNAGYKCSRVVQDVADVAVCGAIGDYLCWYSSVVCLKTTFNFCAFRFAAVTAFCVICSAALAVSAE
ncbi:MAG: uncharacterized protein KVP18_002541 [Porospora cf. gigantea A]|uniref:uncharacterized protein n=1 Tax=Porospora cf. gigantea A TaxID=2853593 RepID=UPI0035594532|nr:MAG: hypothetical protein KVP18_002541 [Porospora cf. gigantea A]